MIPIKILIKINYNLINYNDDFNLIYFKFYSWNLIYNQVIKAKIMADYFLVPGKPTPKPDLTSKTKHYPKIEPKT